MNALAAGVQISSSAHGRSAQLGPWNRGQFGAVVAADGIALGLAILGWWKASGEESSSDQLRWLNLSLVGVLIVLGANGVFLARGRQLVRRAAEFVLADDVTAKTSESVAPRSGFALPAESATPPSDRNGVHHSSGRYVATAGTKRYHRSECGLIAGRDVERNSAEAFDRAGRIACEVCQP